MKKQIKETEPLKFKKFKNRNAQVLDGLRVEKLFRCYWVYLQENDQEALKEWVKYRKYIGYSLEEVIGIMRYIGVFKND